MMHDLMVGMFWGGLIMALPPLALGIGVAVFVLNRQRRANRRRT